VLYITAISDVEAQGISLLLSDIYKMNEKIFSAPEKYTNHQMQFSENLIVMNLEL